ncbi:MAG: hypothetical protein N3D84_02375 [Candidatus Woesearchaeota archaeon]|nr:hypothetical protein [Candidatus Woesearchaeota archaeon]
MQKKQGLVFLIAYFLAILSTFAFAANEPPYVEVIPIKDKIVSGDWAIFDITITNPYDRQDTFLLSVKDEGVDWSVITESTYDYSSGVAIGPRSSKTTRILIKDKGLVPSYTRAYAVSLDVKSVKTGSIKTSVFQLYIYPEAPVFYESDINVTLNVPRYIDPRNIYSFGVNLINNNKKEIKNLVISLESNLVNQQSTVQLQPSQSKRVDFTVSFDEKLKPTIDTLTVKVTEGNKTLYRSTTPLEVVPYRMPFDQKTTSESIFLKYTTHITLTNKDNVEEQQKFMVEHRFFDYLLTKTTPDASVTEKDNKKYFAWDVRLKPDESTVISIETNYRPLLYIFLLVSVILVVYFYFRNPVIIIKSADIVKTLEGGISELKVTIALRNRSKEKQKIRLVDTIPKIAIVEKKEGLTVHPKRAIHSSKGTFLEWVFEMEPKEERFVSYYLKSKLSILGGLKLPPALLVLNEKVKGKEMKIKSNQVFVEAPEEEQEG